MEIRDVGYRRGDRATRIRVDKGTEKIFSPSLFLSVAKTKK